MHEENSLSISYRGCIFPISLYEGLTVQQLGQQIEQVAKVQPETIKLLATGQKSGPIIPAHRGRELVSAVGMLQAETHDHPSSCAVPNCKGSANFITMSIYKPALSLSS